MTGLIGWWPLHESSGSKAYDLSGNGNHGSLNGGIVQGVAGKGGLTGYSFDGSDDFVEMNNSVNEEYISVSAWVKWDGSNTSQNWRLISGRNTQSFALFHDGGWSELSGYGGMVMSVSVGGSTYFAEEPREMSSQTWHHYVGTYDGQTVCLFRDGELVAENNSPSGTLDSTTDPITLGHELNQNEYFPGSLADVRLYDRALSTDEIQELYEWGNGDYARPPESNDAGVSRWKLDGDAVDSWNSNDGTTNGGLSFTDNAVRGQAANFDGSDDYISQPASQADGASISTSAWVKFDSVGSSEKHTILGSRDSDGHVFYFGYDTSNSIGFRFGSYDGTDHFADVESSRFSTGWYHMVGTYDSNEGYRVYVNGNLESKNNDTTFKSVDRNLAIGAYDEKGTIRDFFDGLIDDVRIYNRALKPQEVFELYRWGTRGRDMRKFTVNSRGL